MARQFASRIHFAHLRGVSRDPDEQRSFYEANHLDSDIDMVSVIRELPSKNRRGPNVIQVQQRDFYSPRLGTR